MKPAFLTRLARAATGRAKREEGAITVLSLQLLIASMILGGFAVDVGHGFQTYTQLQATADSAAHAALLKRNWNTADVAKAKAIEVAANMMPTSRYGDVLKAEDIVFGTWDRSTRTFTPDPTSKTAVSVSTRRYQSNNNGLSTFFLRLAGTDELNVASESVFETYYPTCFREGIVAKQRVDIQSNNLFTEKFCIHSQDHVEFNSNNRFTDGVIVSMPDKADVVVPESGWISNVGLRTALRDGSYAINIADRINKIMTGLLDPNHALYGVMNANSPYYRWYITNPTAVKVNAMGATKFDPGKFKTGRVHTVDCRTDRTRKIIDGNWFKQMIIVTDCLIQFDSSTQIEDAVIVNTNTLDKSFIAAANATIGKDDGCADKGDVQLLTFGDIDFSSGIYIYGSQLMAVGNISLTANADGLEGVSVIAGGTVDATANGTWGFCKGDGMGNNYDDTYYRMVR